MLYFIEMNCLFSDVKKQLITMKPMKKKFEYEHADPDIFKENIGLLIAEKFICKKYSSLSENSCVITYENAEINISWSAKNIKKCFTITFDVIIVYLVDN